ncbi:MAG: hypothetical protein H0T46_12035 [Deltaproteobacteria bacterium]|nr:hypothetical protein [Deltaproteobacteria bacterium]
MAKLVALQVLLAAQIASAQPAKAPPAKPAAPAVCSPVYTDAVDLRVGASNVVACWEGRDSSMKCVSASATTNPQLTAAPAAAPSPIPAVRKEAGAWVACVGETCKKLGKKTVAAIKEAGGEANQPGVTVPLHVTSDLKAVVVAQQAFSVAADRPLKLKGPKREKGNDKPELGGIDVVGKWLVPGWTACAGPCAMSTLATSSGTNKGPWFPAGKALVLGGDRIVIVPQEASATMTVLDGKSGKKVGAIALGAGVLQGSNGEKIDDNTVVVAWDDVDADAWVLQWLTIPATGNPTKGATKTIAHCAQ